MEYYIDYGTGAGNKTVSATLEEAKRIADEGAAYTQENIRIKNENGDTVCTRYWCGVTFRPEDFGEENPDIIEFGTFGYYNEWSE